MGKRGPAEMWFSRFDLGPKSGISDINGWLLPILVPTFATIFDLDRDSFRLISSPEGSPKLRKFSS